MIKKEICVISIIGTQHDTRHFDIAIELANSLQKEVEKNEIL